MSRGAGKIERGILSAICDGKPWSTYDLADQILGSTSNAARVSVRRALRKLAARGQVASVSSNLMIKLWCQAAAEKKQQAREQAKRQKQQRERVQREDDARRAAAQGDRDKLAKILAMLSSPYDNEVLTAARRAERQRKRMGLSWLKLLRFPGGVVPLP
jgi:hypothetical protein